jgi:hypothetical protein
MSKLFFDHLIEFTEVDIAIKKIAKTKEERDELWALVDETVHHRVMSCVLGKLPSQHHQEFLSKFHAAPFDSSILDFLNEKMGESIEDHLRKEIGKLEKEILAEICPKRK